MLKNYPALKKISWAFAACVFTVLLIELFIKAIAAHWDFFYWREYPIIYNSLLLFCLVAILFSITNRLSFSIFITVTTLFALAATHAMKIRLLQEVFFFSDLQFSIVRAFFDVLPDLRISTNLWFLSPLSILLFYFTYKLWRIKRGALAAHSRLWFFLATSGFCTLILYSPTQLNTLIDRGFRIHSWPYHRINSFFVEGFIRSSFIQLRNHIRLTPKATYNKQIIADMVNSNSSSEEIHSKPNLILLLAETFWDPLAFPELGVSPDPIPHFRALMKKSISGNIYVPLFGGGTAQTEFEVLTAFSCLFFDGYAYNVLTKRSLPSLAAHLQSHGYKTLALHGYYDWFYNRDKAYRALGFKDFYAKKNFESEYKKTIRASVRYVPDSIFADKVISESLKTEPFFIFGVTSGSHGPFNPQKQKYKQFTVSATLSTEAKENLLANLEVLSLADDAFYKIYTQVTHSKSHIILSIFGDHLPNESFVPVNFRSIVKEDLQLYAVPYVIFDNRQSTHKKLNLSSNFLSLEILNQMRIPIPNYLHKTDQVRSILSGVLDWNSLNKRYSSDLQNMISDMQLIQYDLTFGNQYAWKPNRP